MPQLARYLTRDRIAILAALAAPLAVAAILLPLRASWSNTNVTLLLVVVIVGVSAIGNRAAGALAAAPGGRVPTEPSLALVLRGLRQPGL